MYFKIEGSLKNSGSAFKKAQGCSKFCPHIYNLKASQGGYFFFFLFGWFVWFVLQMWTIFEPPTYRQKESLHPITKSLTQSLLFHPSVLFKKTSEKIRPLKFCSNSYDQIKLSESLHFSTIFYCVLSTATTSM